MRMKFFIYFIANSGPCHTPHKNGSSKCSILGTFVGAFVAVRNNDVPSRAGIPSMFTLTSTSTPSTLARLCSQDERWTHPQRIYSTASLPLLGQGSVAAPGYALTRNYPNHDFRLILLRRSYLYEKSPF